MIIRAEVTFSVEVDVHIDDGEDVGVMEDKIFDTARNEINLHEADAMLTDYEINPKD